jgi:hypothetical protein
MPFDSYVFHETQRFRVWWIWLLILAAEGVALFMIFTRVLPEIEGGDFPLPGFFIPIFFIVPFLIAPAILFFMKLDVRVSSDAVYYRLFPFSFRTKKIEMTEIARTELIEFDPFLETRGWGVHYTKYGKAYTMSGKQGVQIETIKGKKVLIGSQKAHEFLDAIKSVKL